MVQTTGVQARGAVEPLAAGEPFAAVYSRLWQALRELEWDAYSSGRAPDRSRIDREIFDAAAGRSGPPDDHPDARLVQCIRRRAIVDHHADVARLRDRLDDGTAYAPDADLSTSGGRRALATAMEPDVIALTRLRNSLARELGAASYGHLAMEAEGLDLDAVVAWLTEARQAGLDTAVLPLPGGDRTMDAWFDRLDALAGPAPMDAVGAARELAARLGCADLFDHVRIRVATGPLAGWAAAVSIPDDIRLIVRPARSLRDLAIVLHELGHALAYAGTRATGIRAIPSDTQDETMGCLLEEVGARLLLAEADRERLDRVTEAEMTRLATSALFEVAIQDDPGAARQQFLTWYSPLAGVAHPVVWALDTFRTIDPFRAHAYPLGRSFARVLVDRLEARLGEDPAAWGAWLRERLWAPGRPDRFADLATP